MRLDLGKARRKKPEWFFKPLASFAFLGVALAALEPSETPPGQWIFLRGWCCPGSEMSS